MTPETLIAIALWASIFPLLVYALGKTPTVKPKTITVYTEPWTRNGEDFHSDRY
jgi:membrane protein DedA with SNARE-associated domain